MLKKLDIPVFYGTYANLTRLDLSFANAEIVIYKGKKFRTCFKGLLDPSVFDRDYKVLTLEDKKFFVPQDKILKKYAIIPIDIHKPFTTDIWYHFYQLVLSIYPSDFALIEILHLTLSEDKYRDGGKSFYQFKTTGEKYLDNFMFIASPEYAFVRKYLKNYFESSRNLKYLKYILSVYTNSFFEENLIYQYISLMICLEVIVEGKEQLSYKLKRNTAILCGRSMESCKLIFNNVDQLYKLRSAIVHGEIKPSYKHFKEYHEYLKKLVARLIRELVVHNIPTITELNNKLTSLGYGQNKLISANHINFKYPLLDNIQLSYKAIQKY